MSHFPPDVQDLLRRALRGDPAPWPAAHPGLQDEIFRAAEMHGVSGLLHARGLPADWPHALRERFKRAATQQAMWELRHQQLLRAALAQWQAAGIEPVLLKGTPLAYSLYPDPALRRRGDTDLIVPTGQQGRALAVLAEAGWHLEPGVRGQFVSYQATLTRRTPDGLHALDVHWRINNAQVLAPLFTHEELRRRAVPLPGLAPGAWAPDAVDALLIACMHRATHRHNPYTVDGEAHHDPNRLIWLCDIDLLARDLLPARQDELLRRALEKGLARVTLEGLQAAVSALHTPLPPPLLAALAAAPRERPAVYLAAGAARQFAMDLAALPWRGRLGLLRELLLPSPDYMRAQFGATPASLPLLYARRAARGLLKRLRPHP